MILIQNFYPYLAVANISVKKIYERTK